MTTTSHNRPLAAAATMISAMLVIGFIDNFVTLISGTIGLWQFHLMRSILMLPMIWMMSRFGLGAFLPKRWLPVVARSFVLGCSMMLYFGALGFMSIAQAVAGLFTSPIFILLIHVLFMGQRVGPWRIMAVIIGFAGVLLVLQPGADGTSLWMLMPVAGGFLYAVSAIATRSWCEGESAVSLLAGTMGMLGLMGGAMLAVVEIIGFESLPGSDGFMTRGLVWPVWEVGHILLLQAVGSVTGVFLIIRAYQMDEASYVSVFEYSLMVFGPLFGLVLFGQGLSLWQGLGIVMIVAAGVIIVVRSGR